MASALYRILAKRVGNGFETAKPKTVFGKLGHASAMIWTAVEKTVVTFGRRTDDPVLKAGGCA